MENITLTDNEFELITSLRSGDRDTATDAIRRLIWDYLAPLFADDEPTINNPKWNNPTFAPPPDPEVAEIMSQLRALPKPTQTVYHLRSTQRTNC